MLISVALVMLMMVMFAQIFQFASSSVGKMRGIAENDQRSRTLQTVIKADLDKRTYRWVYPFAANENPGAATSNIANRQGYLYISENNPFNPLDDVLQFTVMSTLTIRNSDTIPYYGQALNLPKPAVPPPAPPPYSPIPYSPNFGYFNQPDADDAQMLPNSTGLSTVAEVTYFVRNGSLYRRQLLIREPLSIATRLPDPRDSSGLRLFDAADLPEVWYPASFAPVATTFWADFDYSAIFTGGGTGAQFLSSDSLDNSGSSFGAIAFPPNRFGFSPNTGGVIPGRPKEFTSNVAANVSDDTATFIGRFTSLECSDADFGYPHRTTTGGNIPTDPGLTLALDPTDHSVAGPDDFRQGTRRGEDLLLSNVHAFDVQIWDDGVGRFVDVGDATLPGAADYARSNRLNANCGPRTGAETAPTIVNSIYDTWHPRVDIDGIGGNDNPPFRPLILRPSDPTVTPPNVGFRGNWSASTDYQAGDLVFPTAANIPAGIPLYYRCVVGGTSSGAEPAWPKLDSVTVVDGGLLTWQAVDNRKPLKAIKLEIRFVDTSTQQMRQLTIIHSLLDSI